MESLLFKFAFATYAACTALYLGYAFTKKERLSQMASGTLILAILLHAISLAVRTIVARQIPGHEWYVPWSNWFESFSFFAFVISLTFLVVELRFRINILGSFVMPLAMIMLAVAISQNTEIPRLMPALQSYWMSIHVPVMFTSYAAFANAFGVGVAYLIQEWQIKSKKPAEISFRLPSLERLDSIIYGLIAYAFPILTVGIILGGLWAYDAWGRFWGWDPKETWALITWFVYLVYLHLRLIKGWRGRKTAYLSLAGFGVVLFTYVGVNYLSELHGFLSGRGR